MQESNEGGGNLGVGGTTKRDSIQGYRADSALNSSTSKRGGSWLCQATMRWLGKHVRNDTSSVCLSFWLPGTTRPQILNWPAKNKRLQGCSEHNEKIKVTPQGFHVQRLGLSVFVPAGSLLGREPDEKLKVLQLPN